MTKGSAAAHAAGEGVASKARPQHQYRLDPSSVQLPGNGVGGFREAGGVVADEEGEDWTHFRSSVLGAALLFAARHA